MPKLTFFEIKTPFKEKPQTVYRDLDGLSSSTTLSLTIKYYNYSDQTLYFKVTGSGTNYTCSTISLSSLGSGANTLRNLNNFATRPKPSGELTETLTLTLEAYTDSSYTQLYTTDQRNVTIVWIDSGDGSWTLDEEDNFDGGSSEGWASTSWNWGYCDLKGVKTDYVLSAPYSYGYRQYAASTPGNSGARMYKSFSIPNKNKVYFICNIRTHGDSLCRRKYFQVVINSTQLLYYGRAGDEESSHYYPANAWMRIVIPLDSYKGQSKQISIRTVHWRDYGGAGKVQYWRLDDVKLISKD